MIRFKHYNLIAFIGWILWLPMVISAKVEPDKVTRQIIGRRIVPMINICVEGQPCAENAYIPPAANREPWSGATVYKLHCSTCHEKGQLGAINVHDSVAWKAKAIVGYDKLLEVVITGVGAMPKKGTCTSCSDAELKDAIKYMVEFNSNSAKKE